jgi:hypothetical protein
MTREKLPRERRRKKKLSRRIEKLHKKFRNLAFQGFSWASKFSAFSQSSSRLALDFLSLVFASFVVINDAFMHLMKHCIALFMESFFSRLLSSQDTELLVLGCLKWDVSCVTPLDFIDLIISRLPIINKSCSDIDPEKIRKHAQAFISLAVRGESKGIFFLCHCDRRHRGMQHCLRNRAKPKPLRAIVLYAKRPG